jgi:hypothetical protein
LQPLANTIENKEQQKKKTEPAMTRPARQSSKPPNRFPTEIANDAV